MSKIDKSYNKLLKTIINKGFKYEDPNRKGTYRIQIPSYTFKHEFKDGFPALTTKKLYWKGIVTELLWFLRGDTDTKFLIDNNVNIWNKDGVNYLNRQNGTELTEEEYTRMVKEEGLESGLGRVYGAQWRSFNGIEQIAEKDRMFGVDEQVVCTDQIQNLINQLRTNPMATRHMVTAWNPSELGIMALPPCHWSFEILVEPIPLYERCCGRCVFNEDSESDQCTPLKEEYQFTLKWHQRSVDTFLGLPFNIASYALLAQIIAKLSGMKAKGIIGDLSNVHIYEPHMDAVKEQLGRNEDKYWQPLELMPIDGFKIDMHNNIDQWLNSKEISDFKIKNYVSYPAIKADMLPYDS